MAALTPGSIAKLSVVIAGGAGPYTISGSGTIGVPTSAGTVTYVSASTLTGSGSVPVPTSAGTLTYVSASTLTGTGTVPVPTSAGTLSNPPLRTFSGSGTIPVPTSSGSLVTAGNVILSGAATIAVPKGTGAQGLTYATTVLYLDPSSFRGYTRLPAEMRNIQGRNSRSSSRR